MIHNYNSKLSKLFFLTGTLFFLSIGLLILAKEVWPFVQDEWRNYLKKEQVNSVIIKQYQLYKNDGYIPSKESTNAKKEFHYEREEYVPVGDTAWKAEWINVMDNITYLRQNGFANIRATEPPAVLPVYPEMALPNDVLKDNFKFVISEKGTPVATFSHINFENLIKEKANGNKELEFKIISDDKKVMMYVDVDLKNGMFIPY